MIIITKNVIKHFYLNCNYDYALSVLSREKANYIADEITILHLDMSDEEWNDYCWLANRKEA